MTDLPVALEYAFTEPAVEVPPLSIKQFLALGYVAACVAGLVAMGVVMAMQV